ncbi:hypothetical protein [Microcystis aeruginosa]|uniref:hypothetical protein n=1 Tax=Microcystis aeruginosa TaxID=1126 RepID=UPI0021CD0F34|nr:hypothetical protein [Microcystis aeruginosa]
MIERHRRRLANGEERVYTYGVGADGERQSLSIRSVDDSLSIPCYRRAEKERVVAALLANASLLVVGEAGAGKTFLAEQVIEDLWGRGFPVAAPAIGTVLFWSWTMPTDSPFPCVVGWKNCICRDSRYYY